MIEARERTAAIIGAIVALVAIALCLVDWNERDDR